MNWSRWRVSRNKVSAIMGNKVIVCGGNGAGKSTLGKRLAEVLGWTFQLIKERFIEMGFVRKEYLVFHLEK